MIIIDKLVAGYGQSIVLNNLSVTLEEGAIHGLVGLNGSGKSTFLRVISNLNRPLSGTISYSGKPTSRSFISLMETEPYFYHGITGHEYLTLFKSYSEIEFIESEWQDLFSIPLDHLIDSYSTGMKKKLAILGIIKSNKSVMLFDEPFNGLDIESSRIFSSVLKKLVTLNHTIIITSHILETLTSLCTKIHYLKNGIIFKTFDSMNADKIDKEIFHELDAQVNDKINKLL